MEAVGQLVGLCADQGGLRPVDRPIQVLGGVALQTEQRLNFGEHVFAEGQTPAQQILIEAALALMDAHGHATVQHRVGEGFVTAGVVEGVTSFMDHAEHGVGEVLFVVVGGDPGV